MYSGGWSLPNISVTYTDHAHTRHSSEPWPLHAPSPTATNPPRPMEPSCRPPLHTMLTDDAKGLRLQDARPSQDSSSWDTRHQSCNLPGVNELLSHNTASWSAGSLSSNSQPRHEAFRIRDGIHPPMALEPPPSTDYRYPFPLSQPYGQSTVDDSRQRHLAPRSPHGGYINGSREYVDIPLETQNDALEDPRPSNIQPAPYNELEPIQPSRNHQPTGVQRSIRSSQTHAASDIHGKHIRIEEVPGEGQCYIYANGRCIPTQVDGERVNPDWGLTKANKPRKRLATACLDCREKKIKCEPEGNSCVQCRKAMRTCRK